MKKIVKLINGNKKLLVVYWLILVVFLELTLFNFRFYQSLGYATVNLKNPDMDESIEYIGGNEFKFNSNGAKMTFNNIDAKVKNVYINMEKKGELPEDPSYYDIKTFEYDKRIKVKINIDDAGNSNGIDMPERFIVSTVDRTKYIPLNLSGESHKLIIIFNDVENKSYDINSIAINKCVPFHFSIIRVLLLFLFGILCYIVRPGSRLYRYKLDFKSKKQKLIIGLVVLTQFVIMFSCCYINPYYVYMTVEHQKQYNELAEALLDGHFYLNEEPDPKMADMENPYDPAARGEKGVYFAWDHAYYDGKYYVYFGIVPAVLFNIPAKLLGIGDIVPQNCIVFIVPIFIIMSYILIYTLARRFISDEDDSIPLLLYLMLSTLFVGGACSVFIVAWPDLYTLPIFTALTLAISGLYCWLSAFKPTEDGYRLSSPRLFLGSLFIALIAGSRPQQLLVIFLAIPIFWNAVFKDKKLFSKNSIKQSVCFALPIAVFALFMFWYNYARFGSIFDFGANYNLTTNDMTARGFMPGRFMQGIFSYILQPIAFEGKFPYLTGVNGTTGFMGTTISEGSFGGILFIAPITLALLLLPKLKKELKADKLYYVVLMLIAFTLIIAGVDSVMAGILSRYEIDFCWMAMLAAIIVIFTAYRKYKGREYGNVLNVCISACFIISLLISAGLLMAIRIYSPFDNNPETYWTIASAIQFWL